MDKFNQIKKKNAIQFLDKINHKKKKIASCLIILVVTDYNNGYPALI